MYYISQAITYVHVYDVTILFTKVVEDYFVKYTSVTMVLNMIWITSEHMQI